MGEVLAHPYIAHALQEIGRSKDMIEKYKGDTKIMNLIRKIEVMQMGHSAVAKEIEAYVPPKYLVAQKPDAIPTVGRCELKVQTLRGKALMLNVDYSDTVRLVKAKIAEAEGCPA